MKIHEYNQMMNYLTRPGKVLANNINDKKINATGARTALKRGSSDTTPTPENNKMLRYIDDYNIVGGDKKSTKAEMEAATKRIESYKNQMSKTDEYNTYFNKASPKYYKKVVAKIPVIPPKPRPDMVNGHSDWDTDTWLEIIDPGGWSSPEDEGKRSGILEQELADEYWQGQYQNYLNGGGSLNFNQFMQQQLNNKVSKKINKIVEEKKDLEGIVSILALNPGKRI